MNINKKVRVMKIIHHAILDGKLDITHRDVTNNKSDKVLTAITHSVESTWFGSRHISVARLS